MTQHPADRLAAQQADRRLGRGLLIGLLAVLPIVLVLIWASSGPDESDVYTAAQNTAYELERTPVQGLGLTVFDVQEAATAGNRGSGGRYSRSVLSKMRVESAGEDSRGDLYEFTDDYGDHAVCLALQVEIDLTDQSPSFPTVTVSRGAC
ncbi:hypothetical protein V1634_00130 [Plantactinospora veratri]|uniref:Uncharacterized protein n=1 Tax=Plantactinospora veratri TaxID=1436122 RepID=A0ABU7S5K0_9ACTN